jgi:hypothetical protein
MRLTREELEQELKSFEADKGKGFAIEPIKGSHKQQHGGHQANAEITKQDN